VNENHDGRFPKDGFVHGGLQNAMESGVSESAAAIHPPAGIGSWVWRRRMMATGENAR
jgi:hypothetical protein